MYWYRLQIKLDLKEKCGRFTQTNGGEDESMQDVCRRETTRERRDVGGWPLLRWISERWDGVDQAQVGVG
jgi:hypothetical protein